MFFTLLQKRLLVLAAACLLVLSFYGMALFETNDDAAMQALVKGEVIAARPTSFVMFINIGLSAFLGTLYAFVPIVPWYALTQAIALSLAALMLLREVKTKSQGIIWLLWFASFYLKGVFQMQFTFTAAICGAVGLILLFRRPLPASLFILYAGLLRWGSLGLSVLCVAPWLYLQWLQATKEKRKHLALSVVWIVSAIAAFELIDRYKYRDTPGWNDFRQYNALRGVVTDYGYFRSRSTDNAALKAAGWSRNDLILFENFFTLDEQFFSLERVKTFIGHAAESLPKQDFSSKVNEGYGLLQLTVRPLWISVVLVGVLTLLAGTQLSWSSILLVLCLYALYLCSILLGLATFLQCPPRVSLSLLAMALVPLFYLGESKPQLRSAVLATLALALFGTSVFEWYGIVRKQQTHFEDGRALFSNFVESNPELVVIAQASLPIEFLITPYSLQTPFKERLAFLPFGCSARQQIGKDMLLKFGSSSFIDVLSNGVVLTTVPRDQIILPALIQFYREHYGRELLIESRTELPSVDKLHVRLLPLK